MNELNPSIPAKRFQTAERINGIIKLVEDSRCPKCGKTFNCSTSSKCWCYEFDVPVDTMEKLQEEYDGCLCPACLSEFSQ